jgi:hemolysin activation/secretion protein
VAGTAHAAPLAPAPPANPESQSSTAQNSRDRRFQSSQLLSAPIPAPPETIAAPEMARSHSQSIPQLTSRLAPPETFAEVEMTRFPSKPTISSNAKVSDLSTIATNPSSEQSTNIAQTLPPNLLPQDRKPSQLFPNSSQPSTQPKPSFEEPKPADSPSVDSQLSAAIKIKNLTFVNSTVFKPDEIPAILKVNRSQVKAEDFQIATPEEVKQALEQWERQEETKPERPIFIPLSSVIQNQERLSLSQLLKIADAVTRLYAERGYKTSGAIVHIPTATQKTGEGDVEIQVIEKRLERKNVYIRAKLPDPPENQDRKLDSLAKQPKLRLRSGYLESRLIQGLSNKPLNLDKLQENLRLLQLDPLIKSITARLSEEGTAGQSRLDVEIEETPRFTAQISLDNSRSPSIGSLQRRIGLEQANLLRMGDRLEVGYGNTDGSSSWDAQLTVPLNAMNGTLSFAYSGSRNGVIESPFDDIDKDGNRPDIRSNSNSYELTLRQPIIRRAITRKSENSTETISTFHEFALGLTASLRDSQTFLLDFPFPLSPGADDNGFTRTVALRFFQDYTQQNARQVLAFRSQFNLGLNALGSTINAPIPGSNEAVPDSRFFSWQGQAQWVRVLGGGTKSPVLVTRANAQLADRALLSGEQFAIGGFGSVRGYRQDTVQTDNGLFASMELRVPIRRFKPQGVLQVIPFVDYGIGWNNRGRETPTSNSLLSTGLGIQLEVGQSDVGWGQMSARLDWGIPLTAIASRGKTWQENGITFSLRWQRQL